MASVYVTPERRRQGIGSALVVRIAEEARAMGIERLYLYTPDKEAFYKRLGWHTLEQTQYRGYLVSVMALSLAPSDAACAGDVPSDHDDGGA
jgi:N-acetylglutamate synthase-like GNAT family acetyltransferase